MENQDPTLKYDIKEALYEMLYRPVLNTFQARLDALVLTNCQLQRNDRQEFAYKGEHYVHSTYRPGYAARQIPRLHLTLVPLMEQYLQELNQINQKEVPLVMGYLNQILNSSNNLHDWLQLFPDVLHPPLQQAVQRCGCRTSALQPEDINSIRIRTAEGTQLVKQRMMLNLLL